MFVYDYTSILSVALCNGFYGKSFDQDKIAGIWKGFVSAPTAAILARKRY